MNTFINRVKTSAFFKNIFVVMSGTAVAQLIVFALTPVISRFFDPSDFGVFGSFSSILVIVAAGVTLQYSQAIMLPKEDSDAANVFAISMISVLIMTLLVIIAVCFFPLILLTLFKSPQGFWLLLLFPIDVLFVGTNQSLQAWCIRRKAFSTTSVAQVIRSLSLGVSQVILGFFRTGGIGLTTGSVAANGIANVNLAYRLLNTDWQIFKQSVTLNRMKRMAFEYKDFPLYSATQNVMNAMSQGLPVLLLGYYFDVAVAGAYAFGLRILGIPMNFVLTALRQVLFQKASETYNHEGDLYPLYLKITSGLFMAAVVPAAILFIWSPEIFSWLFGENWVTAGEYARWLTLWLAVGFCNLPSNLFARIIRQQRNLFLFELLILFSRVLVLVAGGLYLSARSTIISFSILGSLLNIFFIIWIGFLIRQKSKGYRVK